MKEPVLVIGASGKVGQALSKKLADVVHTLILQCNRNCGALLEVKGSSRKSEIYVMRHDFLSEGIDTFINKVKAVIKEPPGTVIISVGIYDDTEPTESTEQNVVSVLTVNLAVHVRIIEALAAWMGVRGGTIIVLTDVTPIRGPNVYCGLKPSLPYLAASAGVHALIHSAPNRLPSNVYVVGIALGWVEGNHIPRKLLACIEESVPIKKAIPVQDVVNVVINVIERARFLNGEVIEFTGGL